MRYLCSAHRCLEQLLVVHVALLVLVAGLAPLSDGLAVEGEGVEDVEEVGGVGLDGDAVEEDELRGRVEDAAYDRRLNYRERVIHIPGVEHVAIEGGHVDAVVENLQEQA